jgi:adhesin/invasin
MAMDNRTIRQSGARLLALAGLTGCGGDLTLPTPTGEGVAFAAIDGDDQTGMVGEELPRPLVVSVEDGGAPARDYRVAFSITEGPSGVRLDPDTATTDDDGRAATRVTLGSDIGPYEIVATLVVVDPPPAAVFAGAAVAGRPDTVRAAAPLLQSGRRGDPVTDAPTVVLVDRFGNPVAGAEVSWQVTAGGGEVTGGTTADDAGRATATWTLGSGVGIQKLQASVDGATGSPIVFSAAVLF